jgi:hypothetical protein
MRGQLFSCLPHGDKVSGQNGTVFHVCLCPKNNQGFILIKAQLPLRSLRLNGEFIINRGWKPLPRMTPALNCHFLRTHVDLIPGRPAPRLRQNPAAAMAAAGL